MSCTLLIYWLVKVKCQGQMSRSDVKVKMLLAYLSCYLCCCTHSMCLVIWHAGMWYACDKWHIICDRHVTPDMWHIARVWHVCDRHGEYTLQVIEKLLECWDYPIIERALQAGLKPAEVRKYLFRQIKVTWQMVLCVWSGQGNIIYHIISITNNFICHGL